MKLTIILLSICLLSEIVSGQPQNRSVLSKQSSPYDDLNPVLSPDGKTMYITVANHPLNIGGKKDPGDIWFCTRGQNEEWSEPVHAGKLINDRAFNGIAGFSDDGHEMFLLTHYDANGGAARSQGISVSRNQADSWSRPENISIPYFQNKSNLISGYITPDKSYFVFSAETYGTYGVEDLFVCERKPDGKWSAPKNLGSKINTQLQELCPTLSRDGKTLFFSTNGRKGKGSFDIYSASRLDDSWTNWSEPVNLGDINTEGRDLYYRQYATDGLSVFTTNKNSDIYGDVLFYDIEKQEPNEAVVASNDPVTTPIVIEEKKPEPPTTAATPAISVHGRVINSKTGESIPARITFESADGSVPAFQAPATSEGYSVDVKSLNQYSVTIEAAGFISTREKLDVKTFEMKDLEMNFTMQPIEVGTTVNLKDVLFAQSKTTLLSQSYPELDLVVSFLKENPKVNIELAGHTDNHGNPFQNVKLSQGRVDVVKQYLISKGIDSRRISGKGYGGSKPVASNNAEETRKLNRRVEFTIKNN